MICCGGWISDDIAFRPDLSRWLAPHDGFATVTLSKPRKVPLPTPRS